MTFIALSDRLLSILPPAMVVLVVLNVGFMGILAWTISHNQEYRNVMLTKIVDECLRRGHEG